MKEALLMHQTLNVNECRHNAEKANASAGLLLREAGGVSEKHKLWGGSEVVL